LASPCKVGSARSSGVVDFDEASNGAAEAYRCLAAVFADHTVLASRVTMFTSPEEAHEKTAAVVNLAAALTESGSSVCLVDGDLRNRTLTHDLDADNERGLTNVISGESNVRDVLIANGAVTLLSAGPATTKPTQLFGARFAGVMSELAARFDHVIIDAPPLPEYADAALISRSANETVIVVRPGKTRRKTLNAAVDLLAEANAHLFGIVIVAARRGPFGSRGKRPAGKRHASSSPAKVTSTGTPASGRLSVAELEDREWGQTARVPAPSSNNHH